MLYIYVAYFIIMLKLDCIDGKSAINMVFLFWRDIYVY